MTLIELFGKIRPYVRPYRALIAAALLLTLAGSLTVQVNAWVLRYTVDEITQLLNQAGALSAGVQLLAWISVILIGKELVNILIMFGQKSFGEKIRIYITRDLAQQVIERILAYKLAFFTQSDNQPGMLQTRIDRGIENITRLVQNFFIEILPLFAGAIVALLMIFNASVYVGLLAFAVLPVYYTVSRWQARAMSGHRRLIRGLRENKSQGIISILESIPVIKSFLREDIEEEKQMALQTGLTDTQMKIRRMGYLFDGLKNFIEQIGVVGIIILTTYFVLKGEMSVGSIMFHIMLFNNVTAPIRRLHTIYDQMNDALIYSESFFAIMNAEQVESSGTYRSERVHGHFQLQNVYFTYPDNAEPTLHDINMEIKPGQITALVGLSGAGKSTLINLLDKFYQPDSGKILLDGVDLEKYDTAFVRGNIGLVLQKNHIFNGTVEENISYGNPHASFEEIREAARKSYLDEQIQALPEGYATSALRLSGGQQQKIAIARMFLKNPPVIFLDEPTASLDAISTEQIKLSLDAIKRKRTVIIITHSISQIIDADAIIALQNGRVAEAGTHAELFHKGGVYRDIFEAMARSLNIEKIARSFD